jgi:membrane complex biogenesis BtpA family protein
MRDADVLSRAGFSAIIVENFGDSPFYPESVPPVTVAAITRVATDLKTITPVPIGINVLRNDAESALAIAAATDASFIRVNVLSGTMYTDQGPVTGRAADVARLRTSIAPHVAVLADVMVKHATPPPGLEIEQAARDTWERAGADALIVSGSGTGSAIDLRDAVRTRTAVPEAPLVVGSGATAATLPDLAEHFSAVIVGSSIKVDGIATNAVDADRATKFVEAARSCGLI